MERFGLNRRDIAGLCLAICAAAIAVCLAFAPLPQARAQVAATTVTVGFNSTLKADAGKFVAIPACSIAAKCTAQLELCNLTSTGLADSTRCIFISGNGQAPFSTPLWIGVSETTPATAGTTTTPYGFGTLTVSVPNNEINVVP